VESKVGDKEGKVTTECPLMILNCTATVATVAKIMLVALA